VGSLIRQPKEHSMYGIRFALAGAVILGLTMVAAAGGDTAKMLVGVWQIVKSQDAPPGATVEFTRDGKMKLRAKVGANEMKVDGTYEVKDNAIVSKLTFGGQTKTESTKISKLTAKELVVIDDKGKTEEYKRVK
jgi:uncharacterized protein (TIGR03066 family)